MKYKVFIMQEISAGILIYRFNKSSNELEVLLGKCGGPYWNSKKTSNAWNIPKGHIENSENLLDCAIREFEEETGLTIPTNKYLNFQYLGFNKTSQNKKIVHIFALEHDFIPIEGEYKVSIKSNLCEVEYPPKSGEIILIPELDEAKYINIQIAYNYIFKYQQIFLDRLKTFCI